MAAAVIFLGCAKNEITEMLPKNGNLSFSLSMANAQNTRAAEVTDITLQGGGGIKLYAYQNVSGMWGKWFDDQLTYSGGWGIASKRFSNAAPSQFVAYYPHNIANLTEEMGFGTATFTAGSYPRFTYSITDESGSLEDLVAALTLLSAGEQAVNLKMRHLLSQINFAVKGDARKTITVNNITINGVYSKGVYTFDGDPSATIPTIGTWGSLNTAISYNYSIACAATGGNTIPVDVSGGIYVLGDGGNAAVGSGVYYYVGESWGTGYTPATGVKPTGLNNSLMLLPQTFTAGSGSQVVIQYEIDGVVQPNFVIDLGAFNINWQPNMRYVYLMEYGSSGTPFTVTVSMAPWDDAKPVDLPNHQMMPSNDEMNKTGNLKITGTLAANAGWDMSSYEFLGIANMVWGPGNIQTLDFTSMSFGTGSPYNITLTLPTGLVASGTGITGTAPKYIISSTAGIITIRNNSFYNNAAALMGAVTDGSAAGATFGFGGNGSAIDLADYDMSAIAPNATLSVAFQYDIPQGRYIDKMQPVTAGSPWLWNNTTYTATYTAPPDNQEVKMPTTVQFNSMNAGETWHVASAGKNPSARTANLPYALAWSFMTDYGYYYNSLPNIGNAFYFDFSNVNFNGNSIQLSVPLGYAATHGVDAVSGATSIQVGANSKVMVYNRSSYNAPGLLQSAVEGGDYQSNSNYATNGFQFAYLDNGVNLDPTSYDMSNVKSGRVSIAFLGAAPQQIITLRMQPRNQTSDWTWNAATKTAEYSAPLNNQEIQQPTVGQLNNASSAGEVTWYVASGGKTYNLSRTAVVTSNKTWNYASLRFEQGKSITLDFTNVAFGSYSISIIPPSYYDISATTTTGSPITITNNSVYTTARDLYAAIAKSDGTGVFYFSGNGMVVTFNNGGNPDWNPIISTAGTKVIFLDSPPQYSGSWTWTLEGNIATCNTTYP